MPDILPMSPGSRVGQQCDILRYYKKRNSAPVITVNKNSAVMCACLL